MVFFSPNIFSTVARTLASYLPDTPMASQTCVVVTCVPETTWSRI